MNVIGLLANLLHITLLVVIYLVVPKAVSPDKQETIQHWIFVSFSAIFLLLTIVSAKDKVNIFIIFLVGAIVLSGLIWWVPKYIPEEDQDLASHILIIASSIVISTVSVFYSLTETETIGVQGTGALEGIIGGKRRRR
jgi:hypothetical protein